MRPAAWMLVIKDIKPLAGWGADVEIAGTAWRWRAAVPGRQEEQVGCTGGMD